MYSHLIWVFPDVDVDKPDEKSIMTYVAQFLKHYPDIHDTGPDGLEADVSIHLSSSTDMHSTKGIQILKYAVPKKNVMHFNMSTTEQRMDITDFWRLFIIGRDFSCSFVGYDRENIINKCWICNTDELKLRQDIGVGRLHFRNFRMVVISFHPLFVHLDLESPCSAQSDENELQLPDFFI